MSETFDYSVKADVDGHLVRVELIGQGIHGIAEEAERVIRRDVRSARNVTITAYEIVGHHIQENKA